MTTRTSRILWMLTVMIGLMIAPSAHADEPLSPDRSIAEVIDALQAGCVDRASDLLHAHIESHKKRMQEQDKGD